MATKERVIKVWIEEGCIVCDACETAAPTVFEVTEDSCIIRPEAEKPDFTKPITQDIMDAAEECPVDVIKFETSTEEVADEAPPADAGEKVAEKPAEPAKDKAKQQEAPVAAEAKAPEEEGDPGLQALLKAAKTRGGNAAIAKKMAATPGADPEWDKKKSKDLPPEARQVKAQAAARKASKDPDGERRDFLSKAALTVGWVAFGTGAGIAAGPAMGRFMMPNVLEEPDPRVRVGKMQQYIEMSPGGVNEDYKPDGIWMIREEGRLAALSIICTHLGCIPNWLPNDRKFKCPCHGSGYKPNGINFEGPTPRPLERFKLYIEDGIVVVDKSKKYQYELGQWEQMGSYLEV